MKNQFAVSILVPTHNRSKYAISCLQSLLAINDRGVQVVFHDTSNDGCELKQFASTLNDDRLTYVHHAERLSMTGNHEAALAYAKGEFVCLIGDDDTVLPAITKAVEIAREQNVDSLVPILSANYSWPDFRTIFFGDAHAGRLYLGKYSADIRSHNTSRSLDAGLRNAFQGTDGLPKLYHGLVRREVIERIRLRNGQFFYGTSPDASAAVSLSLELDRYCTWDFPFTLPGASGGSNTGRSALNKHKGDFKTDPHMAAFKNVEWDDVIPKFFSVETVWANAAWETLRRTSPDHMSHFNLNRLYALCLLKHREYQPQIAAAIESASRHPGLDVRKVGIGAEIARAFVLNAVAKAKRLTRPSASGGKAVLGTFKNVEDAQREMQRRFSS
ncbi:glycosyltransferase [Mesorhizobium sp. YIM 152430]|uniref:glycosyltransferase family 2 protein n=1 Tax=Mesorhizobium sp. YIM 152430 TaxID=3031761 RepID=UPI0023DBD4C4|nr:glycosyltransferase [Mesorhizobium sp. YIM 152430]MDF1598904.1 glycosyltransferase [Mesorhizobium sp. YIM 152430]